ncbi:MscS Mechanosensitive ion channel [Hyella patelloides LEGE 07179]|uniref:MscS Mechanosensitive ion channel n=1 Tax=Hyella patelloides LEGE 07179 TaxID=945734 RepID=A0A563VJY6_9CYAN|nr:MscS Mechanosensitive ion channel [Hyella patelloides LEGE 07179]
MTSCIRIDGRCVFTIVSPESDLAGRVNIIQTSLNDIKDNYLKQSDAQLDFNTPKENNERVVDVCINANSSQPCDDDNPSKQRLLTITQGIANFYGMTPESTANLIISRVEEKLLQAKQQRQSDYLIRQGIISVILLIAIPILGYLLRRWSRASYKAKQNLKSANDPIKSPFSTYLNQRKSWNIQDIKHRLLQISQVIIWPGGPLIILGLFPQTRTIQLIIITAIRLPLRVVLVAIGTYCIIRLIYSLINNLSSKIVRSQFVLSPRANKRLQLRINTISQVSKSVVAILLILIGFLFSLSAIGVNTAPFLAGAGIIGLALSFSSQSFIKDALNGFLIIFEDQYAVGDVISLNQVSGLVENINLRITQIRDAEGSLITIPNSEVRIVANLSSQWSRADINIPLSYDTNLEQALTVITYTATKMSQDNQWQQLILDEPQILGVEKFSDRGIIIRVWIRTEPLKQWEVSREFRRRLQIALTNAGIPLTPPQQLWLSKGMNGMVRDRKVAKDREIKKDSHN